MDQEAIETYTPPAAYVTKNTDSAVFQSWPVIFKSGMAPNSFAFPVPW